MRHSAIVLANGRYRTPNAKVAHGLVRGSERFAVLAVVDPENAGHDAGHLLDGQARNIPIVASIDDALARLGERPSHCVVGIATHGGLFTETLRAQLLEAVRHGLTVVNGLHECAADDPQIAALARARGVELIDLRRVRPARELHFWSGAIRAVRTPRIAVLGTDCALGKRTTARLLTHALVRTGTHAEMIYTGQTGWMQGTRYGVILDALINDYVSGELEHVIVTCEREAKPAVMLIEGQSSLRNPSGPCGPELLLSAQARAVILQHAPGRTFFEGYEAIGCRLPVLEDEIALIAAYGAETLAVTLNGEGLATEELLQIQSQLGTSLNIPVVRPIEEGVGALLPVVRRYIQRCRR